MSSSTRLIVGWDGSAYGGHDGMRRIEAAFSENFDDFRFHVHETRDAQDRVVSAC